MSRWFRFYDAMLDDPEVQQLAPDEFKAALIKTMRGEKTTFSRFIREMSGRLPWTEWAVIRLSVFQRDHYTCQYCGASGVPLECDHKIPLSRGGSHGKQNLVAACRPCNRSKADKMPEEWKPHENLPSEELREVPALQGQEPAVDQTLQ